MKTNPWIAMLIPLLTPIVFATDVTGTYQLTDSKAALEAQKEVALEKTVAALNPLLRYPASIRLSTEPPQCDQYSFTPTERGMSILCDDHNPVRLEPGHSHSHVTESGQKLKVEGQIEAQGLRYKLIGDSGLISVVMTFSQNRLTVTKSIESSQLPVPLVMTYTYQKKSP